MNRERKLHVALILLVILAVLGTTACNDAQRDSGRRLQQGERTGDLPPAVVVEPDSIEVYLNVDGFRNVSRLCVDGNGIYVTSRGGGESASGIAVVADDAPCRR